MRGTCFRVLALTGLLLTACGQDLATVDLNGAPDLDATEDPLKYGRNLVMLCAEAPGAAPQGYKYVQCDLSQFKADVLVGICVNATDPDVYGGTNCFLDQRIQADGTWSVAFPLLGGKSYDFATYGMRRGQLTRNVLVVSTATVSP